MPFFAPLVTTVDALRHAVWQDFSAPDAPGGLGRQALQQEASRLIALADTEADQRAALTLWLRLGQLYELAGLVARANLVDQWRDPVKPRLPGGITDMVTTALEAGISPLEALARPVFEVVMTAHPTNVNDKQSIISLREIGKALDTLRTPKGNTKANLLALESALHSLLAARAVPERISSAGEVVPTNLSVHAETDLILYYLSAVYEDLPLVYGGFDRVLSRKQEDYDPARLHLQMRFSSWGSSGDKDGNSQVTAGTTLEAILMHHHEIIRRYRNACMEHVALKQWYKRLNSIDGKLSALRTQLRAALAPIAEINAEALRLEAMIAHESEAEQLASLRAATRQKRLEHFSPEVFERFKTALQEILWELGEYPKQQFLAEIKHAYENAQAEERTTLLALLRRVRAFGFQFARIEFRETAEEYTRAVEEILATYQRLHPQAELAKSLPDAPYQQLTEAGRVALLSRLIDSGAAPLLVAGSHPDIARRGAGLLYDAQNAAPITLHTLLRMELARDFPQMITANVLAECQTVSHLLEAQFLQAGCTDSDGNRPIMGIIPLFEEPDIMQRVGDILNAAYANPTYRRHMKLVAEHLYALGYGDGAPTQQVQIAHSDNTRRAGLAAARALIYQAHDLIRDAGRQAGITTQFFEGGSNSDPFRGGIRSISATANMYDTHDFIKFTFQGGDLLNYFNYPGSTERLFARNLSHMAKTLVLKGQGAWAAEGTDENDHPRNLRAWTQAVLPALIATAETYRRDIFTKEAIGRFLYETRDSFGNTGSRAGARGGGRAKAQREERERSIDPVDMRTITFSESFAHAGITPTWIGCARLQTGLEPVLQELHATSLNELYRKSAVFRDVADRIAFGIATSDIAGLPRYYPALAQAPFTRQLEQEYQAAAELAFQALSPRQAGPDLPLTDTDVLRERIRGLMPHLHGILHHKGAFMLVAQEMKLAWRQDRDSVPAPASSAHQRWVMSLAHAAIDCVTHGRIPAADDPMYRKMAFGNQP